ncbi:MULTISPECIES: hypothetical protein [Kitasatospora]|uniref:Uncharacterized protein n=1 Tax=Kitasatospora setae (strain ATCC 33774 / DSM 43861 / JCM 3304 / KCC A-0304 / NBRC 14216 / KM-6054) TaxID=452652 RepID=E4N0K8_KITSK|nr:MULTISPECIES: hypothetical protein [Kitasatospora]BAJ31692.1 hypothetical protein KSE_59220 [Kitasatospora setae KM-6054]
MSVRTLLADRALLLNSELGRGDWTPGALESSVARRLAGDDTLNPAAVREALWQGHEPLTRTNDARLATLLADLATGLEAARESGRPDPEGVAGARAVLAAVAETNG